MKRQMITIASTLVATLLSGSIVQAQTTATPIAHKAKKVKKVAAKAAKKIAKQRVSVNFTTPPAAAPTQAQRMQQLAKATPGHSAVPSMSQQQQPAPFIPAVNEKWVANPPQPHPLPKTAPKRPAIVVQPKASPNLYAQSQQRAQHNEYQNSAATAETYDTAPDLDAQEGMLRASTHYRQPVAHRDFTIIPFAAGGYSTFQLSGNSNSASSNQQNTGTMDYAGGVLAEFEWGHIGMQTGLVYMTESSKVTANLAYADGTRDAATGSESIHFIGVPLLAKLTSGRHGQVRFSAKAGVIPVFESAGSVDVSTTRTYPDGTTQTGSSSDSSSDTLRSVNALVQAGAGIEIPLTDTVDLRIEGVYNRSLMSLENDSSTTKTYSQSYQGIIGFGVGI